MDDYRVQYEGLFPTLEEQVNFEKTLTNILDEAPTNSFLNAVVSRNGSLIKGQIRINSSIGTFFAAGASQNLEELGQQLELRMRGRLNIWKAQRFEKPTLLA